MGRDRAGMQMLKEFNKQDSLFRQLAFGSALESKFERKEVLGILVACTAFFMLFFGIFIEPRIKTDFCPFGIVSFQFAASGQKAARMISFWTGHQKVLVAFSLGLDFLFIPVYAITICYACLWASDVLRHSPKSENDTILAEISEMVGHSQLIAAGFDAVENLLLFYGLVASEGFFFDIAFVIAAICAAIKFFIILCGIICSSIILATRRRTKPRTLSRRSSSRSRMH